MLFRSGDWSLPLVARKGTYVFPPRANADLEAENARLHEEKAALEHRLGTRESQLRMIADSRWVKFGNRFGVGPKLR